jgi:predicted Holliday junction resolvase-like endonuclease
MPQLYDRIKFKEEHFTQDQIKQVKEEILRISKKLKPLEQEIMNDPTGVLYIGRSMSLIID